MAEATPGLRTDTLPPEAIPKLMAIAEFSVGRGHLISQVATSVIPGGGGGGLHSDQNWLPAPFPEHNMITTMCWATDEFSEANGSTHVGWPGMAYGLATHRGWSARGCAHFIQPSVHAGDRKLFRPC